MNFKKQVMRYRLKADQKIGRANKTEVLNDEMLQIEKRLEHTRSACMSVYKKISQCLQSSGPDLDKRLKKLPETAVAYAMTEASNQLALDSESALQKSLKICAEAESGIAKERAVYEMFVEGHVVTPLHSLVETDIPNIQKLRERLKRLVLDRDNAHSVWQKAYKAQYNPGANMMQMSIKADAMKEELDAAISRMELCKDQLITELFEFMSKEGTYAQHITDFVAKELEYHKKCVAHLEKLEPEIRAAQENARVHTAYGTSLAEHVRVGEREIALPIESSITCLVEIGIYEEGLFRVAGGAAKLKKFRALAGAGVMDLTSYDAQDDVHAIAGTLKHYLRELPDPLLTQALYDEWLAVTSITDNDAKLQEIWSIIDQLPKENKANLSYLIRFCSVLASKQEYNKMSAGNIALVLSPNLLWAPNDDITANMMVSNSVAGIIESMILYVDYFFPDGYQFKVPPPPQTYDKTHDRTPSSGSLGETSSASASGNNGHSPTTPKSPSHTRTPSSDANAVLNHHAGENTLQRMKKKKQAPAAPAAPPGQRSPTSPVASKPAEEIPVQRPPVATRRTSVRLKPNVPPPEAPTGGGGSTSISRRPTAPQGRPRPKPIARRRPQSVSENPIQLVIDSPSPDHISSDHNPDSPPMPDFPPPMLPPELL